MNMAVIRFGSLLYFFVQRKTLHSVLSRCKEPVASEEVEERTRYLSNGGLVSDISWLIHVGEKGIPYFRELLPKGAIFSMPAFFFWGGY